MKTKPALALLLNLTILPGTGTLLLGKTLAGASQLLLALLGGTMTLTAGYSVIVKCQEALEAAAETGLPPVLPTETGHLFLGTLLFLIAYGWGAYSLIPQPNPPENQP